MDVTSGAKAKSIMVPGVIAGVVPFFIHYTVSTPDSYREWTAIGGGAVAIVLGALATWVAVRGKAGPIIGGCAAVIGLGAYDLAKGFGAFTPSIGQSEVTITHHDMEMPPVPAIDPNDPATCPDGDTCEALGEKLAKIDPVRAFAAYWRSCNKNDKVGCHNAAIHLQEGIGTKKDPEKARELFLKSCDLSDGNGCANAAIYWLEGTGGEKDAGKAIELTKKACELKSALGCKNFAAFHQDGIGVAKDPAKALELEIQACALADGDPSADSCNAAGVQYFTRKKPDLAKAREMFGKACEQLPRYCYQLGVSYAEPPKGNKPDLPKARELYAKACEGGSMDGCNNLGSMLNEGEGGPKDKKQAHELFDQACKAGLELGCQNLKTAK